MWLNLSAHPAAMAVQMLPDALDSPKESGAE